MLGRGHDEIGVQPRRTLVRLEPQCLTEGAFSEGVEPVHVVHTLRPSSALRSS